MCNYSKRYYKKRKSAGEVKKAVWCHPDDFKAIKELENKLRKERAK